MEKIYVCTQCGAEYDAPGVCEMCDIELIPEKDSDDESLGGGLNADGSDRFNEFADEDEEGELDKKLNEEEEEGFSVSEEPYVDMAEDEENL